MCLYLCFLSLRWDTEVSRSITKREITNGMTTASAMNGGRDLPPLFETVSGRRGVNCSRDHDVGGIDRMGDR